MPPLIAEVIILLASIAIEAVLWVNTADIPPESGIYPRVLLGLAFAMSLACLLIDLVGIRKNGARPPTDRPVPGALRQNVVLCLFICAYLLLLKQVGYLIMTPLLILGCLLYFGMRDKRVLLLTPLILTSFTYYLFNEVLFVFLPTGILG
jgi:hypothetical protein